MTDAQKTVLDWMIGLNIGAVLFEGAYRFPQAFRRDAAIAERFVAKYLTKGRDGSDAMDYCVGA